jgi:hypothetical protein
MIRPDHLRGLQVGEHSRTLGRTFTAADSAATWARIERERVEHAARMAELYPDDEDDVS